jgi:hypothetical protein
MFHLMMHRKASAQDKTAFDLSQSDRWLIKLGSIHSVDVSIAVTVSVRGYAG